MSEAEEFEFEFDLIAEDEAHNFDGGQVLTLLDEGKLDAAAQMYEQHQTQALAGVLLDAAGQHPERARQLAEMFRIARDFLSAAKALMAAGDRAGAAEAYEQSNEFDQAAESYLGAGDPVKAAAALARQRRFFEASRIFCELKDAKREVEMLRQVPPVDVYFPRALLREAELMTAYDHHEQAARMLMAALRNHQAARQSRPLCERLIDLLQHIGQGEQADEIEAWLRSMPQAGPEVSLPDDEPILDLGAIGEEVVPTAADEQSPFEVLELRKRKKSANAYRTLKAIPMFADLELVDMKDLYKLADEVAFQDGEVLIEQGREPAGLFAIVSGDVRISSGSGAAERELNRVSAGAFLGEISLVTKKPASARAVAQGGEAIALVIPTERMESFLYGHPEAALRIYRLFCTHLAERVTALSA